MKLHDYNIESETAGTRVRIYALIAVASVVIVLILREGALFSLTNYSLSQNSQIRIAFFIGTVAPMTLFYVLLGAFDKYGWKTQLGRLLCRFAGVPMIPDVSGNYTGWKSFFNDNLTEQGKKSQLQVRIEQTWTKISIYVQYPPKEECIRAWSYSFSAFITIRDIQVRLRYCFAHEYIAIPSNVKRLRPKRGEGVQDLRFYRQNNGWIASGYFYTESGGCGEICLRHVNVTEDEKEREQPIGRLGQ